jgi:hypothetical protein
LLEKDIRRAELCGLDRVALQGPSGTRTPLAVELILHEADESTAHIVRWSDSKDGTAFEHFWGDLLPPGCGVSAFM